MNVVAAKPKKQQRSKSRRAAKPAAKVARRATKPETAPGSGLAETRFVNDLRVRGEVAKLDDQGKLPLNATHLETENKDGSTTIRRARFKLV